MYRTKNIRRRTSSLLNKAKDNAISYKRDYEFTFSIIMAIYNVEEYLREAIESLTSQTLDFERHVQLILVNDGSPDRSDLICKEYAKKYPNNIVYIEQENKGVGAARNAGIEIAKGKYLNFMDPDDILGSDVLERINSFFRKNKKVKIVAIPLKFFEALKGDHPLNYKFDKQRIANVDRDYTNIFQSSGASFLHREAIGDRRFPVNKKYGEDSELLLDIVMENKEIGLIPKAIYYYRKRFEKNSALNKGYEDSNYYIPYFKSLLCILEKYSLEGVEEVPKYVQFVIMYDIQWRLRLKELPDVLRGREKEYFDLVYRILSYIDDDIINKQKYLNWYQKNALINFKYRGKLPDQRNHYYFVESKADDLYLSNGEERDLYKLSDATLEIDIIEFVEGKLRINGYLGHLFPQDTMEIYIKLSNGKKIKGKKFEYKNSDAFITGKVVHEFFGFEILIEKEVLEKTNNMKLFIKSQGVAKRLNIKIKGQSSKLSQGMKNSYLIADNQMIWYNHSAKRFDILPYSIKNMLKKEWKYWKELKRKKEKNYNKISLLRLYIRLKKKFQRNKINLFIDRVDKADDSAEVLYEYFESVKVKNERNYFIIDESSPDYIRLKNKGFSVIGYKTKKHKLLLLLADKLISTHADKFIYQPFAKVDGYLKDLKSYRFIFLQHGIIQSDLSSWLKKSDKNIRLFFTSSKYEYNDIIEGNYQFTNREVKLTGLPRFDRLTKYNVEKNLLIMPTWRKGIIANYSDEINARPYSEDFMESLYFKKWNDLLSNQNFLDAAKKNGFNVIFVPHPSIRQQLEDFNLEGVQVADYTERYVDLFNIGQLLITDYSSVCFDFAYTKKPVIYYQFDSGNWDNQNGYFSYEEMGFGPVFNEEKQLVDYIISKIKGECKMDQAYVDRVDNFFYYTDQKNCERVYKEIQKL
ncbi:bifunctional glycosyltransferase/CDP-glycerol:glycerophosphate glycerophosphotransferase [Bacillus rubiinfantis]|uniref:bifunctional glycosyltransferase/CDP-glycerol:glycerophosphate glycerophosphotransferase n=1 Tax=Bacillus rubiinfantis TaxID=1499680 RepID=UPI0006933820|nr:CDP-glycerol glycerophosphotransferase family protein [Bacillus rubiinfantis]